ncbi:DJ-1/PfpI family protein [Actinoallomurus spadix]|uniref:DJ-1/PfpI family protein n=1 Tax=Actinoallomurus spadix TaxID=79912 RepID=A0ABP3G373_9ACTN|nr:DJ-1/PfpI family protein [Actinoallomurus spadix]MCO5987125.1 DJ-1/PfpI family protein [Actinoallomurus spadix]
MQIVFALYEGFTPLDAVGPHEVLSRLPGVTTVFAAAERGPVRSDGTLTVSADAALDELDRCDVLVVPGGPGTREVVLGDQRYVDWVRRVHRTTRWTTSVCSGSLILGAAGLLDGLPATTHWGARKQLEATGATYVPERVVTAGKIVTAAGVSAGIDMALTLAARIGGDVAAQAIQLWIEYDPRPPFDSGSLPKACPEVLDFVTAHLATG